MIRIKDIILAFDHEADELRAGAAKRLGIVADEIAELTIVRRSIDARSKSNITAVYTVDVGVQNESGLLAGKGNDESVSRLDEESVKYHMPAAVENRGGCRRPVVVGSGPCGLFAALMLAQMGLEPIMIERGKEVGQRIRDVKEFWEKGRLDIHSNAQFGEGGAGTFSDGKLTTQIKDKQNRSRKVLEELVKAGGPEEILYQAKPHIGTDNLVRVVRNIREQIISLGGQVRFETKLTGIEIERGKVRGAIVNDGEVIETDTIVLALGHSARDTFEMLERLGVEMAAKAFAVGVRIEHPQGLIDRAQYGKFAGDERLGSAEYKLVHHCGNGRAAYTFCMCPGGEVIGCSSEAGGVVTNGMSVYSRNRANANSALLVGVEPGEFGFDGPLGGVEFQRNWEKKAFEVGGGDYFAPVQLVGDFLAGRASKDIGAVAPSYTPGVRPSDLRECLPGFVADTLRLALPELDKKLRGFAMADAVMTAIESRSSSPVRIVRGESFESVSVKGLYPAGEGAGYAGGIISAAIDGIKVAEAIVQRING